MLDNKVLTKIFEVKRDEIAGEWRKFHDVELYALYYTPNIFMNLKSRHVHHILRNPEMRTARRFSGKT